MQHLARPAQHFWQFTQGLYLQPGHAQDGRQVIGRIGKSHRGIRPLLCQRFVQHQLRFHYQGVGAPDRTRRNIS